MDIFLFQEVNPLASRESVLVGSECDTVFWYEYGVVGIYS